MREILFRGKRTYDGEWLYGVYADDRICDTDFPCIIPLLEEKHEDEHWAVDPNTVGQFTGLNDMDGKKIFEGDICEWEDDDGELHRFRVMFRKGAFVCGHAGIDIEEWELLSDNLALGLKVVGSIYE